MRAWLGGLAALLLGAVLLWFAVGWWRRPVPQGLARTAARLPASASFLLVWDFPGLDLADVVGKLDVRQRERWETRLGASPEELSRAFAPAGFLVVCDQEGVLAVRVSDAAAAATAAEKLSRTQGWQPDQYRVNPEYLLIGKTSSVLDRVEASLRGSGASLARDRPFLLAQSKVTGKEGLFCYLPISAPPGGGSGVRDLTQPLRYFVGCLSVGKGEVVGDAFLGAELGGWSPSPLAKALRSPCRVTARAARYASADCDLLVSADVRYLGQVSAAAGLKDFLQAGTLLPVAAEALSGKYPGVHEVTYASNAVQYLPRLLAELGGFGTRSRLTGMHHLLAMTVKDQTEAEAITGSRGEADGTRISFRKAGQLQAVLTSDPEPVLLFPVGDEPDKILSSADTSSLADNVRLKNTVQDSGQDRVLAVDYLNLGPLLGNLAEGSVLVLDGVLRRVPLGALLTQREMADLQQAARALRQVPLENASFMRLENDGIRCRCRGLLSPSALAVGTTLAYWLGHPAQVEQAGRESRGAAPLEACQANLKMLGTACEMYLTEHNGSYPQRLAELSPKYLKAIPTCPAAGRDTYSGSYRLTGNARCAFCCAGTHHAGARAGLGADAPGYDSQTGVSTFGFDAAGEPRSP